MNTPFTRLCFCLIALLLAEAGQATPVLHIFRQGPIVCLANTHYMITLDMSKGLAWGDIRNQALPAGTNRSILQSEGHKPIFELSLQKSDQTESVNLNSCEFTVHAMHLDPQLGRCEFQLLNQSASMPLAMTLSIQMNESCQSLWTLSFSSPEDMTLDLAFPILENLVLGDRIADMGYFFPRDPGLMHDIPTKLLTCYGQYATSQLMATYNDHWGPEGGGLYVFWQDTSLHRKSFELIKVDPDGPAPVELLDRYGFPFWEGLQVQHGIGMACHLPNIAVPAGKTITLPSLALGIHTGNWRQALADYQTWGRTWYKPDHPSKLARFFTFESYHGYENCRFWAPDNVNEAIQGIPDLVDQLHFIAQKEDRYGVYEPYREDWGLDGLRQFIKAAHAQGKLCSHYVQGTVAHETSTVYQENGADWGQKNADGSNAMAWANQCMCLAAAGWANWLADTCARLVRDLDIDIAYLDCVGWTTLDKFQCANTRHSHQPAWHELADVRRLFHTVKTAITRERPDAALTTEGPVADLFFNDVDGNEGYGINFMHSPGYGVPIHFMRFLYPRFKYLDLLTDTPERVKLALFNATATAANPAQMPEVAMAHRIFHEHVTAFTAGEATPHLPVREPGVYCNRFATTDKTIYTVWNHNLYPVAGAFVPVTIPANTHVIDLVRHQEAKTQSLRGATHLVVDLKPKDVGVFAVVPKLMQTRFEGMWLQLDDTNLPHDSMLLASLLSDDDCEVRAGTVERGREALDFVTLSELGTHRVVLRLLRQGEVLDEVELPCLEAIDIAAGAVVTASNVNQTHGAHPESVIGQTGSWQLAWDDEPRPGWLQLSWDHPQTLNNVAMTFSQAEYSSRDCEVLASDDGQTWRSLLRGSSVEVCANTFNPITTQKLRIIFHQGGPWANLVSLTRLQVRYLAQRMVR